MTPAARKITAQAVLLSVSFALAFVLGQWDKDAVRYRVGTTLLAYDSRATSLFDRRERPRVVDSGMHDGRGLSFHGGFLYVADAWEGLHRFPVGLQAARDLPDIGPPPEQSGFNRCPENFCQEVEYGGLFVTTLPGHTTPLVVMSDAYRQKLLLVNSAMQFAGSIGTDVLRSVKDATVRNGAVLVAENEHALVRDAASSRSGALVEISNLAGPVRVKRIASGLTQPVGIAYSAVNRRVYVADLEESAEVWSFYESVRGDNNEEQWRRAGTLWRQAVGPERASIRLQGMVIGSTPDQPEVIVAAGPDGLYLLHPDGFLLGKFFLGRPVAGVAWGPPQRDYDSDRQLRDFTWLYFTMGRQIVALRTLLKPSVSQPGP